MRLLLLVLLFPLVGISQVRYSSNTKADIEFISRNFKKNHRVTSEIRNRFAVNAILGDEYVSFLGKKSPVFNKMDLTARGVIVGAQINDIVSFKYPIGQLDEVLTDGNFSLIQLAGKIKPMLDKVAWDVRADSVWMGYGLPQGYTGKDIIIGVTDWGFDYTQPMFYDTLLQNTRIIAAWDQFKTSGPAPAGYTYGTEYSTVTDLINAGSDTANIYSYHTHGTHVAGIAGGSGAGTAYRGMAFEANYLFTTFQVDASAVLDAWEWMYNKAEALNKRLVINMSWGLYHMEAIDGTSLLSQALDYYSDLGVIFATSAGNNGSVGFHIKKDYSADTLLSRVDFYYSPTLATLWGQSIHMWGEPGTPFSGGIRVLDNLNQVVVESPWYSTATTTNYVDSFLVANGTDTIFYNLSADAAYPTNGRPQMRLRVKYPPSGYKIVLKSEANSGTVHYWNVTELTTDVGNWGMPFLSLGSSYTAGDDHYGIGTPACSNTAISVAAYAAQFYTGGGTLAGGAVASFSSVGPLMTDSMKPDIAAPGIQVASSISSFTDAAFTPVATVDWNGRTYPFAKFNGTSMSSPVVAGVCALILDANPYLESFQVKDIIIQTARTDNFTGVLPPEGDTKWGHGKINAYAAVQLALNTIGVQEIQKDMQWELYPNPATNEINIKGISGEELKIQIIDLNGKILLSTENNHSVNVSGLNAGTYFVRIIRDSKVEQQKFIKQ